MYLKSLKISKGNGELIRDIEFHHGLNLIIDETHDNNGEGKDKTTGNNVGKTTVLRLIDFCLNGSQKRIYSDPENLKLEYKEVKDFLVENEVLISLVLKADLSQSSSREVLIERNFLPRKKKIQRLDGIQRTEEQFEKALANLLFPGHYPSKPSFRQIISHNIRHEDQSLTNTLRHLHKFTTDVEYETLYLFLFGCDYADGNTKQELSAQIKSEENFKKRLESEQTKAAFEAALALLDAEIQVLEEQKSTFNLNLNIENDLAALNDIKYQINLKAAQISKLELRRNLIVEARTELEQGRSDIDIQQLRQIYEQATSFIEKIQRTFEDLVTFHNKMVTSKVDFITKELPDIEVELTTCKKELENLLERERLLSNAVTQSDSFEVLEELISQLNDKHRLKGEYISTLQQLNRTEESLSSLRSRLSEIDDELFSDEFELKVKSQLNKFNRFFSLVSDALYGEKYAIKADVKKSKKGRLVYDFTTFNTNFSTGTKQGEISCFDIAYTLFADDQEIPVMHFLLNDKKELMHDNQLVRIADFVNKNSIQFVASILRDKLPSSLKKDKYAVVTLSQSNKLFRI